MTTPDRDTLARDLLTLPALVGAPAEVVRGLCLVSPEGERLSLLDVDAEHGWYIEGEIGCHPTADLHAAGWRVDLDAGATWGVLSSLLFSWLCSEGDPDPWSEMTRRVENCSFDHDCGLAEAAARALVEVAHVE